MDSPEADHRPLLWLLRHFQVTQRTRLTRKAVDDVLGGEEAWENVDSTESTSGLRPVASCPPVALGADPPACVPCRPPLPDPVRCPKCDNMKAYWMQLQIRSADEPMTTF